MRKSILLLSTGLVLALLWARQATTSPTLGRVDRGFFIENKGQWHPDVLYLYRGPGLDAWITRYGLNLTFTKAEKPVLPLSPALSPHQREQMELEHSILLGHRVLIELEGANLQPFTEGLDKKSGYYNYLLGNDPSKHARFVGLYGEVLVREVYPGISLRYYLQGGWPRYDYLVAPGADPSQIRFRIRGADRVEVKGQRLVFSTRFGPVELCELKAYQGGRLVPAQFVAEGNIYRIVVGPHDRSQALVIDPLVYSTYIGGSMVDYGEAIAVDGNGSAYVTGYTQSSNYDTTPGVFQGTFAGGMDVFVTKLNASGSGLVYSTFLGGSGSDQGQGIAVDGNGQVYVAGSTNSSNFHVSSNAFQGTLAGFFDAFVTKLNAGGSNILYSTYLGGSQMDQAFDIAVDGSGQAYVTGQTMSDNFDVTSGAFQSAYSGSGYDAFVTKLNANGTGLVYSTYLGAGDSDQGFGIAVDGSGHAYVTGSTQATDFPVTSGAYQSTKAGGPFTSDVFVTKLNPAGNGLVYSTYIGGGSNDAAYDIAVDGSGNAYITGETESANYDVTTGAYQGSRSGGKDLFVTKLNTSGSELVYSTYLGGSRNEIGFGIAVDGSGQAYVTGWTDSDDYDLTTGVAQGTFSGGNCGGSPCTEVFVTKLNASGGGLVYSTYLGGTSADIGKDIAIDGNAQVYVVGSTESSDFDTTSGAFQTNIGGASDVFVAKLNVPNISTSLANSSPLAGSWRLYPNPSTTTFFIENVLGREAEFEVIGGNGQVLRSLSAPVGVQEYRLSLPAGVYMVRERRSGTVQRIVVGE
ncbi:MAG: SBBP repeat-containing protein [Bacteroidia bacterium]